MMSRSFCTILILLAASSDVISYEESVQFSHKHSLSKNGERKGELGKLWLTRETAKYNELVQRSIRSLERNTEEPNSELGGITERTMDEEMEVDIVTASVDTQTERTTINYDETFTERPTESPMFESDSRSKRRQILDGAGQFYLPTNHNKLIFPTVKCTNDWRDLNGEWCGKVPVLVYLDIIRVQDIDENLEVLTVDLDLTLSWVDGGVRSEDCKFDSSICYNMIPMDPSFLDKVWKPNIFIDEMTKVKKSGLLDNTENVGFVPGSGWIEFKTRLRVELSCEMNYEYYPADTQNCTFTIRSYTHFSQNLTLSWETDGAYFHDRDDPNFYLQLQVMKEYNLTSPSKQDAYYYPKQNIFDILNFSILARRKLNFHMVQTYLPSVFFVIITWLCFLVPSSMVEARIGITMTTLLTLTSMFNTIREQSPQVSYVKAIDIWVVACTIFIFMTLLEFIILLWLRYRRKALEDRSIELMKIPTTQDKSDIEGLASLRRSLTLESMELRKYGEIAEFVEKYAFWIFSTAFILFNIIYWTWLPIASRYFTWNVDATYNSME